DNLLRAMEEGGLEVTAIGKPQLRKLRSWAERVKEDVDLAPPVKVSDDAIKKLKAEVDEWAETIGAEAWKDQRTQGIIDDLKQGRANGTIPPHPGDLTDEEILKLHRYVRTRIMLED